MLNISETVNSFPEYAKDIKLNYTKIINEQVLNNKQLYGIILISSLTTLSAELKEASLIEVEGYLDDTYIEAVYGAYAIMSMNAIYYRFTHLATEYDYAALPANLRMQYMTKHNLDKVDFEMLSLAVAVIIGCGKCINAHEVVLRENNVSSLIIQTVARIASIINAVGNIMKVIK